MPVVQGPDPTDVVLRRVLAWLADGFIGYLLWLVLLYGLGIPQSLDRTSRRNPEEVDPNVALAIFGALLILVVVTFGVRVVLTGTFGWTIGKLMLGLRVVRYDGRPPGLGRAFVRSLVDGLGQGLLSCFYDIPALACAMTTAGHRQPADMAAGTYVIDSYYLGRLIMRKGDRVVAGPASLHRDELEAALREEGIDIPVFIPPDGRITEPFFDKNLGTQVVYSTRLGAWLQFDKKTETWSPIEPGAPTG